MENKVEFKVYGRFALFTDPLTKIGGEKCSYHIPTYEALKGILESVYWKPTIIWLIDKVRIMKPIRTQTKGVKPIKYSGGNELSIYTYLAGSNTISGKAEEKNLEYQVQAHFEWNRKRDDMAKDRNDHKHWIVAKRMIERGGRRDIFLGARECQGYVEPCKFGEDEGAYDNSGEVGYGLMFHGFDYPDELGKDELYSRFWYPKMINGVVEFIRPEQCKIRKFIKRMKAHPPASNGLEEESLKKILVEEGAEL